MRILTGIASHISTSGNGSSEHFVNSWRNGGLGGGGNKNSGGGPGPPHSSPHSRSESNISHIKLNV